MAKQYAIQDQNRFPALIGHSGTAGTADTVRVVADTNGNLGNTVLTNAVDGITTALKTVTYEHHEIHSGSHYFIHSTFEIPASGDVLDFTWLMPDTTKWIHWTWEIETSKGVSWYVYEDATATNPLANTITPLNSNRNSGNSSGTTMKYELQADLAAANADTDVTGATLLESGVTSDNRTAGDSKRDNELILKQGKLYVLRAVATAACVINFKMDWYEHTNVA